MENRTFVHDIIKEKELLFYDKKSNSCGDGPRVPARIRQWLRTLEAYCDILMNWLLYLRKWKDVFLEKFDFSAMKTL